MSSFGTVGWRYSPERVAAAYEAGYWADERLTDYLDRWAEAAPDRTLVSDGTASLTYAQARAQAYRMAAKLIDLGIKKGDRVVVQLPNWSEYVVCHLALARLGAVMVPVMPIYREHEVTYVVENSGAIAAITCGEFRKFDHQQMFLDLRKSIPALKTVVVVRGDARDGALSYTSLTEPGAGLELPSAQRIGPGPTANDGYVIVYTSGTESRPKGCYHTFNTFGYTARENGKLMKLGTEDVSFVPTPATHTTGLAMGVDAPLIFGGGIHLLDVWDPAVACERIRDYRCTHTTNAATFLQMLLQAYDAKVHDLSSMRIWMSGGAPVPPSLVQEAHRLVPGMKVTTVYGRSETLTNTCTTIEDTVEDVAGSDGRAQPGVELRIVDEKGNDVPPGTEGEILYRGPGLMLCYWGSKELTEAAMYPGGWSRSGDLGRMDERGYLRVTGRLKDVIVRGGTNISALEIENELITHPSVVSAAVVAEPHERLGERACAFVVLDPDAPAVERDELLQYLRNERRVAVQKLPERIVFVPELPTTASGKIQKGTLREQAKKIASGEVTV